MYIEKEIVKIKNTQQEKVSDFITVERQISIYVNGDLFLRVMCSPVDIKEFVYGFFFSNGYIEHPREIRSFKLVNTTCLVEIKKEIKRKLLTIGSSCFTSFFDSENLYKERSDYIDIKKYDIINLMKEFQNKSRVYRQTGGVHSAGLTDGKKIVFFSEDIGRHNAVDKVIGKLILSNSRIKNKILLTSGRVSSEIVLKSLRAKFDAIVSSSTVTSLAVELAEKFKIVLVGFARGRRFNIYTGEVISHFRDIEIIK